MRNKTGLNRWAASSGILLPLLMAGIARAETPACTTLIAFAPKSIEDRDALARRAASKSGDRVETLGFRSPGADVVAAAIARADILVTVQRIKGDSGGFLSAIALRTSTGETLGDMAVPSEGRDRAHEELAKWYAGLDRKEVCGTFQLAPLLERLQKDGRCDDVAEILSKISPREEDARDRVDQAAQKCRLTQSGPGASGSQTGRHMMGVRFEGVPGNLQEEILKVVDGSGLDEEMRAITTQIGQLLVSCINACDQGRFFLKVPFDEQWYKTDRLKKKDPLEPYHSVMKRLLAVRARSPKALQKLPVVMDLVSVSGAHLQIDVTGTAENPRGKSSAPMDAFFKSAE